MPGVELTVYFAHQPTPDEQGVGFGIPFAWDEDFVAGYHHVWLPNAADVKRVRTKKPFRDRFWDYDVPEIAGIISREGYDAFLLHGWRVLADWQALRACEARRIPVLVRGDSQLRDDSAAQALAKRPLYTRLMRRFAGLLERRATQRGVFSLLWRAPHRAVAALRGQPALRRSRRCGNAAPRASAYALADSAQCPGGGIRGQADRTQTPAGCHPRAAWTTRDPRPLRRRWVAEGGMRGVGPPVGGSGDLRRISRSDGSGGRLRLGRRACAAIGPTRDLGSGRQ